MRVPGKYFAVLSHLRRESVTSRAYTPKNWQSIGPIVL